VGSILSPLCGWSGRGQSAKKWSFKF